MSPPGWIFWGLFVVCVAIAVAYALWIWWVERP